jgi:hypothetical protein
MIVSLSTTWLTQCAIQAECIGVRFAMLCTSACCFSARIVEMARKACCRTATFAEFCFVSASSSISSATDDDPASARSTGKPRTG